MSTQARLVGSLLCIALISLGWSAGLARADLITGSENVTGTRTTAQYTHEGETYGPYEWSIKYTRSFDGTKLEKHVEIDFQFDEELDFNLDDQADFKAAAEAAIEAQWNNKFVIRDNDTGLTYPITVDVTTEGPFDQTVQVHQGPGRSDMTNWHHDDTGSVQAHEFGHMLGLFDEYDGGAVDQYPNPTLSEDGLMGLGALNANPVMYPRYYQQYLDYMFQLNPIGDFSLVEVPEPATWVLLALGMGCLVLRGRTLRRRAA